MRPVLETLSRGSRVLFVRLRSLGDCVLTTPALTLVHAWRPDLEVGVVVEDRFAGVYEDHPAVRAVLAPRAWAVRRYGARLCVNLHGGVRGAALTAASLARWRAGFAHLRFQWLYNLHIPRAQEILGEERTVHTAEHIASVLFWLGVPRSEIPRASMAAAAERSDGRKVAVLHPFASAEAKAWPAERFAALARVLRDERGYRPVILGGAGDDFTPFAEFETRRGALLREVKPLLAASALFVGNDSGPAHMAAAFGLPVVVLYGSSDPVVWAPWRTRAETIVAREGLTGVALERVLAAVDRLEAER
jgi:heptosyltransferase-3